MTPRTLQLEACVVDLVQRVVVRTSGESCTLTSLEAELLGHLARYPGQDVHRDELLREVWKSTALTRAVDFTVRRLRVKLGEPHPPRHVLTVHGVGYRFVPLAAESPLPVQPVQAAARVALATGELDLGRMVFLPEGEREPQALTAIEGRVLQVLAGSLGSVVSRERLVHEVWGAGHLGRALEGTLSRLRAKLDPHKVGVLHTHRHAGVRLDGARTTPVPRTNVEPELWIDRDERRLVEAALSPGALVTLTGPGGTGKTALARAIAWGLAQRGTAAWFVDLTRAGSDRDAGSRVAEVLGDAQSEGTLLVLDNVEQLAADTAFLARLAGWRRLAPPLRLLLTSRTALQLEGEVVVALDGLPPSQGARLYNLRAGLPDTPDDALVQLVKRLEGNPLAIELAAGRAQRNTAAELLERLDEPLEWLVSRPEGARSQHSTLRGALDWSWDLLDPEGRALLMRCAPLAGALDGALVQSATGRQDARQGLEALARQSLLRRDKEGYRWHELVRVYAAERLSRAPFLEQARSDCAAAVLESAEDALEGRHRSLCLSAEELCRRMPDLERLVHSADPRARGRAALVLSSWSLHQGLRGEARALSGDALARGVDEQVRGRLLAVLAASSSLFELPSLLQAARSALPADDLVSHLELARALAAARRDQFRLDETLAMSRELAEQARSPRLPASLRGRVWLDLANVLVLLGDPSWSGALARAEELAQEASDDLLFAQALRVRALAQPDPGAAAELVRVMGKLRSPALHQGSLVKAILIEQVWGRYPELAPAEALPPVDMGQVIDLAAQMVASWLEPGTPEANDPDGILAFSRAIGLLAAEQPQHARAMVPGSAARATPLAALAMAQAECGDETASDSLARASGLCRTPSERRLVELARAHLALIGGEPGAIEQARTTLALGQVVPCAPGVLREIPIEVSLARTRLELVLARKESQPLAPDGVLLSGTAPSGWLERQRAIPASQ
jgi:DNA-binding response OmpR family regulator